MKSYTGLLNYYKKITQDTSTDNASLGAENINDTIREIISLPYAWDFLEETATDTTVASQQSYFFPYNYEKLYSTTITVGNFKYPITEVTSRNKWDELQITTAVTSNIPQKFFVDAGKIYYWPTPSTNGNTITYNFKKAVRDLSVADYTTGTVTLTNGSKAVTGSGTTFTAAMVGRYIQGSTDKYWYKIASYTNATSITLEKNFGGITVAGESYTIGEMPILPETYHNVPVWKAAQIFWTMKGKDENRATMFETMYKEGLQRLIADHGSKTSSPVIEDGREGIINPNLTIWL